MNVAISVCQLIDQLDRIKVEYGDIPVYIATAGNAAWRLRIEQIEVKNGHVTGCPNVYLGRNKT